MTDQDPFEERLTRSLGARVAPVHAAAGTARTARDRAARRRRRTTSVVAVAAATVTVVAVLSLRQDTTAGPEASDAPTSEAATSTDAPTPTATATPALPDITPCADGTALPAQPPSVGDLQTIAASGTPGSVCRYTNPSTGDPVQDTTYTLTAETGLDADDTARIATTVLAAPALTDGCTMEDSPPPVELVAVFATDEGLRTLHVPTIACLGIRMPIGPDSPTLPSRASVDVIDLLRALLTGPQNTPRSVDVPGACLPHAQADRGTVQGVPVWVRFCPGREGYTAPAEVPSDALTTHLDLLADLVEDPAGSSAGCPTSPGRTYRLQVGFPDGTVAEVTGHTDPGCVGQVRGGSIVVGPADLGVYGTVMKAFGRQYADAYDATPATEPLVCPSDPREPGSVDLDGPSADLDTGYELGVRRPMLMPLTAVRGILCTEPAPGMIEPVDGVVRQLGPDEAERIRIGMHAVDVGMVDCGGSFEPTYTAVVEDETGTRRAITVIDSECSTVVLSEGGYGLHFEWLDRYS